jgi:hypothetical protein
MTPVQMREVVSKSCTMIVCLNDETTKCERCVEEWRAAIAVGIPIQCVIDKRCSTRRETTSRFDRLCESADGASFRQLQELQWVEYTDQHLEASVRLLEFFLRDAHCVAPNTGS